MESAGREKIKKPAIKRKKKKCKRGGTEESGSDSFDWSEHSEGEESETSSVDIAHGVYAQTEKEEIIEILDDDNEDDDDGNVGGNIGGSDNVDNSGDRGTNSDVRAGEATRAKKEEEIAQSTVEDDEDDTNGEVRREHVLKLQSENNRLMMVIQGFRGEEIKTSASIGEETSTSKMTPHEHEMLTATHHGKVFLKNHCYEMAPIHTTNQKDITVGIQFFINNQTARCILISKFEDTILGTYDDEGSPEYKSDFNFSTHVQVHKHVKDVHLSKLKRDSIDVETIPSLIYEPQTVGTWNNFGYFYNPDDTKRIRRRRGIRCLEIFAGAGGSLRGYHEQGFETVMAVEKDESACNTLRENYGKDFRVYEGCVKKFIQGFDVLKPSLGRIDMVQFSSPCQGFSGANRNITPSPKDLENNHLSYRLLDLLRLSSCPGLVFENVQGIWRRKCLHYVMNITKEALKMGYQVRCMKLRAMDYGDPQKRPRIFMFIVKKGYPMPSVPRPTHGPRGNNLELLPFVTVKEAIGDLKNHDDTLHNMDGKKSSIEPGNHGVVRLEADGIAPSIRSSNTPHFHYEEDRPITVREAASLQSFPIEYKFCGNLDDQYRQVGNAVPVGMATAVARSMRDMLTYEYEEI